MEGVRQLNGDLNALVSLQPQLRTSWCCNNPRSVRDIIISASGVAAIVTHRSVEVLHDCVDGNGAIKHELVGEAGISSAVCSGKDLVTGGSDGFVKWWRLKNGEEIASTPCARSSDDASSLEQSQSPGELAVSALASSGTSDLVAAATGRSISIFGCGGEHLHTLPSLGGVVTSMTWISDSLLAVATEGVIQTWRISHGVVSRATDLLLDGHGLIKALSSSHNGAFLAASTLNMVFVWDVNDSQADDAARRPLLQFNKGEAQASCLSWDASSRYLAAAFGNELFVWDVASSKGQEGQAATEVVCIGHAASASITSIAFQSSGPLLGAAADDGTVLVFNSQQFSAPGLVRYAASGHLPKVASRPCKGFVAWHPSGAILAAYESGDMACFGTVPEIVNGHQHPSHDHMERPPVRGLDGLGRGRGGRSGRGGFGRGDMGAAAHEMETAIGMRAGMAGGRVARGPTAVPPGAPPAAGPRGREQQPAGMPPQVGSRQSLKQELGQQQQQQRPRPEQAASGSGYGSQDSTGGWGMAPQVQWQAGPQYPQYMMYPVPQGMAGPQGMAMAAYPPRAPPPGSLKPAPGVAPPSGSSLSTSVWSPNAGMAMAAGSQVPMYMYPQGQWPGMQYMQQWPGYGYGYYGYPQAGAMPGAMAAPVQMTVGQGGMQQRSFPAAAPAAAANKVASRQQRPPPAPGPTLGRQGSMEMPATMARQHSGSLSGSFVQRQHSGSLSGSFVQPASGAFLPSPADLDDPALAVGTLDGTVGNGSAASSITRPPMGRMNQQQVQQQPSRGGLGPGPGPQHFSRPGAPAAAAGPAASSALASGQMQQHDSFNNVYVGNLTPAVDEAALYSHFIQFGFITGTQIIRDKETKEPRGFGFVKFSHPSYAAAAIQHMNGVTLGGPFGGLTIKVSTSRKSTQVKPFEAV